MVSFYVPADPLWALRPGPFARSKAAVWLQLFLLCALMACHTSHTDGREDLIDFVTGGESVDHGKRLYWIQDPRDGLCVGEAGMAPCGDANLWGVRRERGGRYSLEFLGPRQLGPKWADAKPSTCLARKHCHKGSSPVVVSGCNHCGAKGWSLDGHGRIAQERGSLCMARSEREVYMAPCTTLSRNGTDTFRLVEYQPFALLRHDEGSRKHVCRGGDAPYGMVKDEQTGLIFPADMGQHLGPEHTNQVYMGGGAFKILGIDIYQVALYIDAGRAASSPELLAYQGMTRQELAANESFYWTMMSPTDPVKYDRSIYVKLLIPLNAGTVKKSLEAEWNMDPVNKKILLDNSFHHAAAMRCCGRGTELVFTWTKEGVLEVRLADSEGVLRLVEVFPSEVLAQDLFFQYVCDDPISPHAKKGFVSRFPELLSGADPSALPVLHPSPSAESSPIHSEPSRPPRKTSFKERWGALLLLAYCVVLILNLPNSKRRFQERLRRGGGSLRARALEVGKHELAHYMTRVVSSGAMEALVKGPRLN